MKRTLTLFFASTCLLANAQSKEFFFGPNVSNYHWLQASDQSIENSNQFLPGGQIGFMRSKKDENIFGNRKFLKFNFAACYSFGQSSFSSYSDESTERHVMQWHSLRFSVPVRLRFASSEAKQVEFFGLVEPGINFNGYQLTSNDSQRDFRIEPINLFVNGGIGSTFVIKHKKELEKSQYRLSAVTITASKYMALNPIKRYMDLNGILDQYQFNIGLRYSYEKVTAAKKLKKRFFGRRSS